MKGCLLSWSYAKNGQINCLFRGNIHDVKDLKHRYGLEASADEKSVIFEMYKFITSGEISRDSVLKELTGLCFMACKYIFWLLMLEAKFRSFGEQVLMDRLLCVINLR